MRYAFTATDQAGLDKQVNKELDLIVESDSCLDDQHFKQCQLLEGASDYAEKHGLSAAFPRLRSCITLYRKIVDSWGC
jgi:hypothetical protein